MSAFAANAVDNAANSTDERSSQVNDSITVIKRARLIADPKVRTHGERTFVEIAIAYNTYGAKDKERYVDSYIVNVTVSGAPAERIGQLRKGDTVTAQGTIQERLYNGKTYKDMQYAEVTIQKAAFLEAGDAPAEPVSKAKASAPVNDKGSDTNPFASDDLPF